jgi:thymidylate synthase ThyX
MEVQGKYGIRARVLKKSRSAITENAVFRTFEIEYPRLILAELNTHRMLSKNSASSRAIPYAKMLQQLTARPVRFGEANPGMQDKGTDHSGIVLYAEESYGLCDRRISEYTAEAAWESAKEDALKWAKGFYEAGFHKQVYNRLVEPFQMMKTVISGTEWANFFWLRDHGAADPTIAELAGVMKVADECTEAETLQPGEWHLPYIDTFRDGTGTLVYGDFEGLTFTRYTLEDAIKVSCARCAAVSFRNVDYGLEKSREVYERLVGDERKHASAFEHCGTPMKAAQHETWIESNIPTIPETWEPGISHMTRDRKLWSGNLKGFVQYRKLIPGENFTGEY